MISIFMPNKRSISYPDLRHKKLLPTRGLKSKIYLIYGEEESLP